ncbi:MAG: cysteine synthase family protein [Clostridia bacterium]|nr:cysteine synthase family protein [Clostridia bacterium]
MLSEMNTIGNTLMIKINYEYKGRNKYIYTKLEYYNLTGSIKDRVAYYIINNAKKRGELKDGMPIIEATSGNTGIALAALGSFYNHPVYIFMPDWVSKERINLIKNYGANVILYSKEDGGFIRCVEEAKKMAKEQNAFLANQFASKDNFLAHYETTAEEIIKQLPEEIYGFISGVGTGGTLMGTGKRLKEQFKDLKIVAIEPDKMPIISQGKAISQHKIEGIGDDFVPDLVDRKAIDDVVLVNDDDAINMSRKLAKELGLGVGISSGANLIGSILLNEKIDLPVATVFADDNKKYLSTDLANDIDENEGFLSNQIKLIDYEVINK